MSIIKVINGNGKYYNTDAKENAINYILKPHKVKHGYVGGVGVSDVCPAESMQLVSEIYNKTSGVQLRHYVVAFEAVELTNPKTAFEIACRIATYIGKTYQIVFAVHEDKDHLHIHFVANTVSYIDGRKYRGTYAEFFEMKSHISKVLKAYGIKTLMYEN